MCSYRLIDERERAARSFDARPLRGQTDVAFAQPARGDVSRDPYPVVRYVKSTELPLNCSLTDALVAREW